jgi:hypothetical protein
MQKTSAFAWLRASPAPGLTTTLLTEHLSELRQPGPGLQPQSPVGDKSTQAGNRTRSPEYEERLELDDALNKWVADTYSFIQSRDKKASETAKENQKWNLDRVSQNLQWGR